MSTPKQRRTAHRDDDTDTDEDVPAVSLRQKEEARRAQRNQVRDQNRPNYVDSDDSIPEWSDDEVERRRPMRSGKLDESFEQIKQREQLMEHQQKARLKSFTRNRRRSSESMQQTSADDFSCFLSCMSLKSVDPDSSNEAQPASTKCHVQNFIISHQAPVNRISDIYVVPAKQLAIQDTPKQEETRPEIVTSRYRWLFMIVICFAVCYIFPDVFICDIKH